MRFLSAIVTWSLQNRAIVVVATLLFIVVGVRAASELPIDAIPDVSNVQVQIITAAPALSPVEVEQYVSVPVERSMSGLPHVTEIRSLSKYGLSVVTVVFTDETEIYFARRLVLERMREAEDAVPAAYGKPEMGPISSALGEIYQFTLQGEGYSLMQLEEELDWYIGPQLRSVPGVVELNSFGGENKQYQVVIDPQRLQASGFSVQEVVQALERSNANAGGGYIEHNREQLVIGTDGLVTSLEDLKSVVIGATREGMPITVAHIGNVQFGARLRRGAASMDGKGETVVGVTLMLIGANSRSVTEAVKDKIKGLETSLPKGMKIVPFYDRAALVERTIHTVAKNLAEGAVLVIVVLLLLLGNLRAGLIVAATIPLSMLFAISVMNATGMSGNLMSLGAIDFGLIVDGAVIIVENAVRRLGEAHGKKATSLTSSERIDTIRDAAIEVRSASVFGEAILAIVYLPILALRGMEGKLFHPMAITVLLAIAGAFILSLTLIPVLCSYFLKPADGEKETWLMRKAHRLYVPLLDRAVRRQRWTLVVGFIALVVGIGMFTRIGAEFVPQLDEGDLLLEVRRLPGVSLSESIAIDTRIQRAIDDIPEVVHVVGRIGAPEVATDPMGIEQSDVYLILKPREEWRPGLRKDALAEEIVKRLEESVPEAAIAVSQPIQMRTNELIAGIRSDVAAQVYGPDLDVLQKFADEIAEKLKKVPGAVDVRAAQALGLTYLRIKPDRARLARYGLTVEDVNRLTETISVGHQAGMIFERDRRFELVVKVTGVTGSLDTVRALPLKASTGQVVPLGDVAEVKLEKGPALVSRDQQSRRATVELNVRDRDLVTVVDEAKALVEKEVKLPAGYRVEWGGQFENFLAARRRLAIIVPLALSLILFMLWMAFGVLKPALLIFLNIPFAITGGVVALWLRDIPFSISAGVGFIALFGVAVLNGLVLVSFSRHLEEGGEAPHDAIRKAAELRLRPVLMTAFVAALGFLPMALSQSPGSEVQRPLATVVIGGLISATALTLLLFPAFYDFIHRRGSDRGRFGGNAVSALALLAFFVATGCQSSVTMVDAGDDLSAVADLSGAFPPRDPKEHPQNVIVPRNPNGRIIENIELTTFVWSPDAAQAPRLNRFLSWLVQSDYWVSTMGEYGVGKGSNRGVFVLPGALPARDEDVREIVRNLVLSGTVPVNENTLISFVLPASLTMGPIDCRQYFGYHSEVFVTDGDAGYAVPFAINGQCGAFGTGPSFEALTEVVGHEIAETATLPEMPYAWYLDRYAGNWGGGVTDLCADLATSYTVPYIAPDGSAATDTYFVTRIWSNAAAATTDRDPCQPVPGTRPYFNASLQLPATFQYNSVFGASTEILIKPFALGPVGKIKWRLRLFNSAIKVTPNFGTNIAGDTISVHLEAPPNAEIARLPTRIKLETAAEMGGKNQWLDLLNIQ